MKEIKGRCLCGEVQYKAEAEMLMAYQCHCKDCQKFSGTSQLSVFAIPEDSLQLAGKLKFFEKIGDTGSKITLGFCNNCGSNILAKPESAPGIVAMAAGSLDDIEQFKPTMNIFTESAPSWCKLNEEIPNLPGMF